MRGAPGYPQNSTLPVTPWMSYGVWFSFAVFCPRKSQHAGCFTLGSGGLLLSLLSLHSSIWASSQPPHHSTLPILISLIVSSLAPSLLLVSAPQLWFQLPHHSLTLSLLPQVQLSCLSRDLPKTLNFSGAGGSWGAVNGLCFGWAQAQASPID